MADYIDREELLKALKKEFRQNDYIKHDSYFEFKNIVEQTPSVDAVEQKHGHWIRNAPNRKFMQEMKDLGFAKGMGVDSIFYTCSECNMWGSPYMKYCSHCGAKMDEEVKE